MALMYLFLKRLCTIGEPALVGLNSTYTMVVILLDGSRGAGTEGSRNGGSERLNGYLTILPSVHIEVYHQRSRQGIQMGEWGLRQAWAGTFRN